MSKVITFVSSWNALIAKSILMTGKSLRNQQNTFLVSLSEMNAQVPSSSPDSLSQVVAAGLRFCDPELVSIGYVSALEGVKVNSKSIDSVRCLLRGIEIVRTTLPTSSAEDLTQPLLAPALEIPSLSAAEREQILRSQVNVLFTVRGFLSSSNCGGHSDDLQQLVKMICRGWSIMPECYAATSVETAQTLLDILENAGSYRAFMRLSVTFDRILDDRETHRRKTLELLLSGSHWEMASEYLMEIFSKGQKKNHVQLMPVRGDPEAVRGASGYAYQFGEINRFEEQRKDLALMTMHKCMSAEKNVAEALAAALIIGTHFNLDAAMIKDLRSRLFEVKMRSLVTKGKWMIAFNRTKSTEEATSLYLELRKAELYSQATQVYSQFSLWNCEAALPPVSEAERIYQREKAVSMYLRLPDGVRVVYVDCTSSLAQAREALLPPESREDTSSPGSLDAPLRFVGVDSEWEAERDWMGACVLQLAVTDAVFILSLCRRGGRGDDPLRAGIRTLLTDLFSSGQVVKAGWGFGVSDISQLIKADRDFYRSCFASRRGMLDLQSLAQKCFSSSKDTISLSDACSHLLGRPLDKGEQLSSWARRPLTPAQLSYAALDAHCLLALLPTVLARLRGGRSIDPSVAELQNVVEGYAYARGYSETAQLQQQQLQQVESFSAEDQANAECPLHALAWRAQYIK